MRIVAGRYRGRKLIDNKFEHIRPTTDKVRQALFTKLQFFVPEKRVLDLFCGTGALGIEALSRGAGEVVFVDSDPRSVELAQKNLGMLSLSQKVVRCDALTFLDKCKAPFDLILLDPPYKSGLYEPVLKKIHEKKILSDEGIIVCEHANEDKIESDLFEVFDEKRYGTIVLTYLRFVH